jgi:molecular chaperone HscB
MCWHCQSEVSGEYFCERCVKVQPVSKDTDYFTCFGFPRRLTLDQQTLEAKFYDLSRAFHPDFYQNKSETEQAISLGNAATLNTAYRTLRDPIQRA